MDRKEREKFVRELVESEWALNRSLRRNREDVITAIVDRWEEDIEITWDDAVVAGYEAGEIQLKGE